MVNKWDKYLSNTLCRTFYVDAGGCSNTTPESRFLSCLNSSQLQPLNILLNKDFVIFDMVNAHGLVRQVTSISGLSALLAILTSSWGPKIVLCFFRELFPNWICSNVSVTQRPTLLHDEYVRLADRSTETDLLLTFGLQIENNTDSAHISQCECVTVTLILCH